MRMCAHLQCCWRSQQAPGTGEAPCHLRGHDVLAEDAQCTTCMADSLVALQAAVLPVAPLTLPVLLPQWCFTIKWPNYHFFSKDDLKLCFDEQEEADRQAFTLALLLCGLHGA